MEAEVPVAMSRPTTTLWAYSPDEATSQPIYDWDALRVKRGRFGSETLSLVVPYDSPLVTMAKGSTIGQEFYGYGLWVKHTGSNNIVFRGPVINVKMRAAGPSSSKMITLELEGHLQHALKRRLAFSSDNTDTGYAATRPNAIAIDLIDDAMGGVAGPVTPTGYPITEVRTDFKSYTYQAGSATGTPATITWSIQSGKNLQDVIEELCLRYDMCPVLERMGAAHYHIHVDYPYEGTDLSASVCLTPLRGSMVEWDVEIPYELVTVGAALGAGEGITQIASILASGTATYGVCEDQITVPDGDADDADGSANAMLRAATPLYGYEVQGRHTSAHRPLIDYTWRDTVRIYEPGYGYSTDQTLIGYDYAAWNGGRAWSIAWQLREKRPSVLRMMADKTGMPCGRSAGGRWRDTRGG